jgi:transposase-like protein
MNLIQIQRKFNTHAKCIAHLEKVRWNNKPVCPYCNEKFRITSRRKEFRHHCNNCNKDFSVLVGTIFEDSKLDLPIWFYMIALMMNSPLGISSKVLSRDLDLPYKTAWYAAMRIRCAMLDQTDILEGIVEFDEAYIGGKPRKSTVPDYYPVLNQVDIKRGRGTKKIPVVGIASRGKNGKVATEIMDRLTTKNLLSLLKSYVKEDNAIVITDEFLPYKKFDEQVEHLTVNHKKAFAKGIVHVNTIEGFWSIVKDGVRGNYNAISKKYLPFYLAEFAYKYSRRNNPDDTFNSYIQNALTEEKCMTTFKPNISDTRKLAYKRRRAKNVK